MSVNETMNEKEELLSVEHLEVTFNNSRKHRFRAVKDANFKIYKGETFALVGESGSGKTTIARGLMALYVSKGMSVRVKNASLCE